MCLNFLRLRKPNIVRKFRVKVEPFDSENEAYCLYYTFNNGLTWKRYEHNELFTSREDLCRTDFPYLYYDFDLAVEAAKKMTEESVKAHEIKQSTEYWDVIDGIRKRRAERDRTFST